MVNPKTEATREYAKFLKEIKDRIRDAQLTAMKAVNHELIALYWDIGKRVMEKQRDEKWGDSIIKGLACDLQNSFPGMKGFSARNIQYMKTFYENYKDFPKLQTLSAKISWSHNVAILEKCEDNLAREFYIRMSCKLSWSYRNLLDKIDNQIYEKTLLGQTNFEETLPKNIRDRAKLLVKDEYAFEFLELADDYSERQL